MSVSVSAETEYLDLFRQRSERTHTTLFAKESFAKISASRSGDTLSFSAGTVKRYVSFSQKESHFTGAAEHSFTIVSVGYAGTHSFFSFSGGGGLLLNSSDRKIDYNISLSAKPFGPILEGGFSVARDHSSAASSLLFYDFAVPVAGAVGSSGTSYFIRSSPAEDFIFTVEYDERWGNADKVENGYSILYSQRDFGKKLSAEFGISSSSSLISEVQIREVRNDGMLFKDGVSFGEFAGGNGKYSRYALHYRTKVSEFPLSFSYWFDQLTLFGNGHIESWPFTTFAASIIANRLHYRLSGSVKHHQFSSSLKNRWSFVNVDFNLAYHRFLPDAVVEHWEPEFLVFGMKNFTRNPFSIRDAHVAGLGLRTEIPFSTVTVTIEAEQYIPVSIRYRNFENAAAPPGPPQQPQSGSRMTTDGGRKIRLLLSADL